MAQRNDAILNLASVLDYGPAVATQNTAVQTEIRSTDTDVGRIVYPVNVDPENRIDNNSAIAPPPESNNPDSFATLPAELMAALPIVNVPIQRMVPGVIPGSVPPAPDAVLMSAAGIPTGVPMTGIPATSVMSRIPTTSAAMALPITQPVMQTAGLSGVATAVQAPGVQTTVQPGAVRRVEADLPDPLRPETIIGKYAPEFKQPILEVEGLEEYRRNGYGNLKIHYVKQSAEGHLIYQTICVTVSGPTVNPMGEKVNLNVTTDAKDLSTIILERDHRGDTWHQVALHEEVTPADKIREIIKLVEASRSPGQPAPAGKLNLKLEDLRFPYKVNCAIAGIMMTSIRRAVHVQEITTTRRSAANPAYIGMNPTFVVQQQPPSPLGVPPGYIYAQQTPVPAAVGGGAVVYRQ